MLVLPHALLYISVTCITYDKLPCAAWSQIIRVVHIVRIYWESRRCSFRIQIGRSVLHETELVVKVILIVGWIEEDLFF